MMCRHCRVTPKSRPRGLCWSCYYAPGVRELYPSTSKYGRRGMGIFRGKVAPATFPTDARPGSEEKIAILAERVRLKQALWHPHDATLAGPVAEALVLQAS